MVIAKFASGGKKALIVSPYLDHLGGGERYMLSVAAVLESLGNEIYFAWDNLAEVSKLASMLGIKLVSPQLDPAIKKLYFANNPLSMYLATRAYDIVVYLSDGSIPLLGGKHNILHMQVPFHGVGGRSWKNQLKKRMIDHVIVNSQFTKEVVDKEFGLDSTILYPPVKRITCTAPKENIILSVGRFEPSLNAKKQDILIDVWHALSPRLSAWKLVLAGASTSDDWLKQLKARTTGLPVEFAVNASYDKLCDLYSRSSIYWHAAGYGIDEHKNPELTEHFGITTVEAISAGCLPLVVPYGGQREIVTNPDLHWTTKEELLDKTLTLIASTDKSKYLNEIKINSYTSEAFAENLAKIII
jgi:glycosyltransferase involved in cell wall biosynthesis